MGYNPSAAKSDRQAWYRQAVVEAQEYKKSVRVDDSISILNERSN